MSEISYSTLFSVAVLHEYYEVEEEGVRFFPPDYNILNDLGFIPTPQTRKKMRDQQLIFQPNPTGFQVLARSLDSVLSTEDAMEKQTFVYLGPESKLQFFMFLRNPYFFNFTNLRLTGSGRYVYSFSNRTAALTFPDLSRNIPEYPQVPGPENRYELGDLVLNEGSLYEVRSNLNNPAIPFNSALFNALPSPQGYVTVQDRYRWQGLTFRYSRDNGLPGESITFELLDEANQVVQLGTIPGTEQDQGVFQAPAEPGARVDYSIDLKGILPGPYRMNVNSSVGTESFSFFLLDPMLQPSVFGIIEIYADPGGDEFRFVRHAASSGQRESIIQSKFFQIRFKNRTTIWKYFDADTTELTFQTGASGNPDINARPRIALTRQFIAEKFNPDTVYEAAVPIPAPDFDPVPNAPVDHIYPVRDEADPNLISAIYSEIYLNR